MNSPWLILTLYVIAAVAVLWGLVRLARLVFRGIRSATSQFTAPSVSQQTSTASTSAQTQQLASDTDLTAKPPASDQREQPAGLTILKPQAAFDTTPPVQHASPIAADAAAAMSATSPPSERDTMSSTSPQNRDWQPAAWANQPLLRDADDTGHRLPKLRPEDVPVTRTDDYLFGTATPVLAAFLPDSDARAEEARKELQAAGYYEPHAAQNFAALRYVLAFLGLLIAGTFLVLAPARVEWIGMLGLILLPLLGWAVPRLYVRGQAAERRTEIERGMPDLLDMLNMCVSQGLTIPDALRRILPDLRAPYPALAQELRIVDQQATLGSMSSALENFSQRVDIPEVHSFTSLLTQTERMGTSISEALVSYSDTMRESLKQRVEEKGNRATFRLLFPTVLCLMPAVYLFLMGPAIVELSNFFDRGGRDSLDQGSAVIQRMNDARTPAP